MYCPSKNTGRVSLISFVALLVVALCLFAFAPAVTFAQSSNTGIVSGTVVDPSNAIVPGASISLVNTATLATRSTLSNKEGQYVFAFVDPGMYSIKVSKTGFKTTVVANQQVKVGLQTTANVTLQVGETSTTVEVTSTPGSELQTLTPTVGATLSGAVILNLPNQSRDASTLAVLQPGQNINGATGGAETDQNSFQIDGGFATDDMSGDNNTYIRSFGADTAGGAGAYHSQGNNQAPSAVIPMPVSTVQEFKVSTSNQTADFNGGAGSQVQVLTKKGTNQFHGTAYEYYLDNNFGGANTWDNNSNNIKQPGSHFSRFGVDAGGKIPHLNVLGGAWYIFGGYEGFRFPQSAIFKRVFPTSSLRAGLIKLKGASGAVEVVNLNTTAIQDPALAGVAGGGPSFAPNTATIVAADGTTLTADPCTGGPCDPLSLGMNPVISALWSTTPLPNDFTAGGDGFTVANALYGSRELTANTARFDGPISTPQKSNFEVFRIDHDFAKNEHFNGTYHYYKLTNTVSDQWDVGGFFPGDTPGQYSAIRQKPQVPWVYTAGLTTDINANMTNSFTFSYTRNWWAYGDPSGVPNVAGFPAALELGGETSNPLGPYNTNNQSVRTRYWNGHDSLYRDDITWIKGNHLFQFGGSYLRANDTHNRNDNGESINTFEQYIIGEGTGSSLGGFNIAGMGPGGAFVPGTLSKSNAEKYGNYYSMILGMVDSTQSLFTRGLGNSTTGLPLEPTQSCVIPSVPSTSACVNFPSLTNNSIIPTYNVYFTDSWHLKPTFSLNYGIGYTIEMPPFETQGGVQTVMVDGNDHILSAMNYLNNEKQAALQGLAYAPLLGFATVRNVQDHSKYPYDPFYGGISPRIGFAWNFRPDTVIRGGYARIFGRVNGVNPILVPMLTPGLLQPVTCGGPNFKTGTCGGDPTNLFRVGVNGTVAPLPAPSAFLPQPWFPGANDVATGSGETFDPNFKPDRSDEFTLSVQHQFGPKVLAEVGYIGRKINNEIQYYSLTNVPYMMTQGGQTFANAWRNIMVATNYGNNLATIPAQPFFESGLNPAYCNGSLAPGLVTGAANCTEAFVQNNAGNMNFSDPFDSWTQVSGIGGFSFPGRTITSDPISTTCVGGVGNGCNGQSPSMLTTVSNGYGNYNAGYLQLTFSDYHGLTMKTNFSFSNALGTGNVVQASSSFSSVDAFNLKNNYGPQIYNEKFVFNLFLNYASPFYASQQGIIGHLLGGWSISPLFVWGGGFPVEVNPPNEGAFGACGTFGECNQNGPVSALENGIITQNLHYSATRKVPAAGSTCGTSGPLNVFSSPDSACPNQFSEDPGIFGDPVRAPILGLDGQIGGGGPLYGLPFWNLDLGITKKIKIMERLSSSLFFDFSNVANHMQPRDPCFFMGDQEDWGVLGCGGNVQANQPRRLQLGISFDW
jgi:carboxypeptidase family protein